MIGLGYLFGPAPGAMPLPQQPAAKAIPVAPPKPAGTLVASRPPVPLVRPTIDQPNASGKTVDMGTFDGNPPDANETTQALAAAAPAGPSRGCSSDHRPALLAHVAGDRVEAADVLPRRPAPLPAAERLHPGPGAGGGARRAVDVDERPRSLATRIPTGRFFSNDRAPLARRCSVRPDGTLSVSTSARTCVTPDRARTQISSARACRRFDPFHRESRSRRAQSPSIIHSSGAGSELLRTSTWHPHCCRSYDRLPGALRL